MYESISKNNELENEMTLDMSYFWYSDETVKDAMMKRVGNMGDKSKRESRAMTRILVVS